MTKKQYRSLIIAIIDLFIVIIIYKVSMEFFRKGESIKGMISSIACLLSSLAFSLLSSYDNGKFVFVGLGKNIIFKHIVFIVLYLFVLYFSL